MNFDEQNQSHGRVSRIVAFRSAKVAPDARYFRGAKGDKVPVLNVKTHQEETKVTESRPSVPSC